MKRVAFFRFTLPDPITGKMKTSRYRVQEDQLPRGAVKVESSLEWRDLPETPEELDQARFHMHSGNLRKRT